MPIVLAIPVIVEGILWVAATVGVVGTAHVVLPGKEEREQSIRDLGNAMSMSNAQDDAKANADSGSAAATCAAGNCPPPECKNLVENMDHKNRKLKKELRKYDPASDAQGGHSYMGADGVMKVTKPGGHYKEIRDIQRGLKNDLEQYNKSKCYNNQGPADKATREAAQKGLNEPIEVPPGMSFIPL
jgi:hypothetical protein